eukprot:gnl/TRDRNA2_/TRDRNA2_148350_c0_seq1.p1 gnl/TRDRNA2_/TRDRNA2_148350_c0~~gnl/TRDRNA2_/TRDRNA2_148350_c0_seq1.p1  ORF type:complete len:323 (+),score=60.86 gnl/TRDRNA2_/TRDRNA2_148350_c0_seq1:143-1111(+)
MGQQGGRQIPDRWADRPLNDRQVRAQLAWTDALWNLDFQRPVKRTLSSELPGDKRAAVMSAAGVAKKTGPSSSETWGMLCGTGFPGPCTPASTCRPDVDSCETCVPDTVIRVGLDPVVGVAMEGIDGDQWAFAASPKQIGKLAARLHDPDPEVRVHAAEAFGRMGAAAAEHGAALATALNDENPSVRCSIAWALGEMGELGGPWARALSKLMTDRDAIVRQQAIASLAKMGRFGTTALAEAALAVGEPQVEATPRRGVSESMLTPRDGWGEPEDAEAALAGWLSDKDPDKLQTIAESLGTPRMSPRGRRGAPVTPRAHGGGA